jgi:hypothetical protein
LKSTEINAKVTLALIKMQGEVADLRGRRSTCNLVPNGITIMSPKRVERSGMQHDSLPPFRTRV